MVKVKQSELDTEEKRNARTSVGVPMPAFFRAQLEEGAAAKEQPIGPYIRDLLAGYMGVTLPVIALKRRSKYASPEEAKAAQQKRAKDRSALIKQLLAEHFARQNGTATAESQNAADEQKIAEPVTA